MDVWFNRGRWLSRCPVCTQKSRIPPKSGDKEIMFFCGGCYPQKIERVPKRNFNSVVRFGYSQTLQKGALQAAMNNDEVYIAVLPKQWEKAQQLLMVRQTVHQGFYPGGIENKRPNNKNETIADLQKENETDPLLWYLDERKPKSETLKLDDKIIPARITFAEQITINDQFFRKVQ